MRATARCAAWAAIASCALALGGCSRGGTDAATSSAPASDSATADAAPTPTSDSPSPGVLIPTVALADSLPPGLGPDPTNPTVPQATLVAILSEQLTDGGTGTVQTVVCSGDLPAGGSVSVSCTATSQEDGRSSDSTWVAYATHNTDGTPAVLWVQGAPLSPEFQSIIGAPGAATLARSIGPAYGTDAIPAQQVHDVAADALAPDGSSVFLRPCSGTLTFTAFVPVTCLKTGRGGPQRVLVLPGAFLRTDPGLLIVIQSNG